MEAKTVKITGNNNDYPMYFKVKDTVLEKIKDTNQVKSQRVVGIATTEQINVGDTLIFFTTDHLVTSVTEPRPAKGKHPIDGVLFQEVTTHFIDSF